MLFYPSMSPDRRRFLHAIVVPTLLSLAFVLIFVLQRGMDWDLDRWGVLPRTIQGLPGIVLHPFVHGGISHLINNLTTFFVLATALFYFYRNVAYKVLILLWLLTGVFLWIIGRDSYHIGASGVIYGLAFFIFWGGLLMRNISLMAISLAVVFWYGSMVWDMLPFLPNEAVSWEGHLSGAVAGSLLAFMYRKAGGKQDEGALHVDGEIDKELEELALKYDIEADEPKIEESSEDLNE